MGWIDAILDLIAASAIGHFAAGIALSVGDRLLSRPRPTSLVARLGRRLDALKLLAYLRDLEAGTAAAPRHATTGGLAASGPDADAALPDADELREACAFLRQHALAGELRLGEGPGGWDLPGGAAPAAVRAPGDAVEGGSDIRPAGDDLLERWRERARDRWQRLRAWLRHEKINPLGALDKLKVAYLIEIVADLLEGLAQLVWGRGHFLGALGHSIYQGAALGLGLMIGGFFCRRRDHRAPRRLRKAVERLERELERDPHAIDLLERVRRGELPVVSGRPREEFGRDA
ncbi:MAG: hypothetical protein PVF43_07865 [Candidatus Eiseniibacteriota bacterium]|jgi:hypothetical protein